MKRVRNYLPILLLGGMLLQTATVRSQQIEFGGKVMQQAGLSTEDFVRLSQPQLFGTARSMSMAGAFTSLGGDVSSALINPAGLGMFRSSEVTITPLVTVGGSQSSVPAYQTNGKTRVALSNLAVVYNAYQGSGAVTSVSLALGYHRVADLNYRTSYQWSSPGSQAAAAPSILNLLAGQLTANDVYPASDGFLGYGNNYPDLWGAILAYNSYLISPLSDDEGNYWEADRLGRNARVGHFYDMESTGSISEFYFSGGVNLGNRFYIGATIGIQSVSQKKRLYYGETYRYLDAAGQVVPAVNAAGQELIEQADFMHYNQSAHISGTGVNFKIGGVWRPTDALRVGFALHTPTYYSLDYEYDGQMAAQLYDNDAETYHYPDVDTDGSWVDAGGDAWQFVSPTRLMFGVSYTFGSRGVVSIDYERDWYNGIRAKSVPYWVPSPAAYHRDYFKSSLKGNNTVRIGAEFKPLDRWALRAGFSFSDTMIRHKDRLQGSQLPDRTLYVTAGTGFQLGRGVSLDVAYQYGRIESNDYRLFYARQDASLFDAAETVSTTDTRHNVAFTLGFRF